MLELHKEMTKQLQDEMKNIVDEVNYSHVLKQSVSYTLLNWGKLFRPTLCLMVLKDLTGDFKKGIKYAIAIEMTHVYGIIHDDLPALDDANSRRKKIANHLVYGDAQAILAGDALLAHSFKVITDSDINDKSKILLVKLLSEMIGPNGYVGGQSLDIISEKEDVEYLDDDIVTKIHFGKTGALIKAAVMGAGIIGNATADQNKLLEQLSYEIGMAFQIRDDIIDVTKSDQEAGKDTMSDAKKDKATYPKVFGLEKSFTLFNTHIATANQLVNELFGKDSATYSFIKETLKIN